MSSLKLSRLLSDGAVIQRRKSIHIWGWDASEACITIKFEHDIVTAKCDGKGRFDAYLPARESGGPYTLVVSDDEGNVVVVKDILVGLVWLCSGQSNMELPIARTRDQYPELIDCEANDHIRTFKVVEETNYKGPNEEHNTGSWSIVCRETIMDFSATAYFFAAKLQRLTGQPIGLINVSLGGSRIQSWMSREMLEGYDELLEIADKYADDDFRESIIDSNAVNGDKWRSDLLAADKGITGKWDRDDLDISDWKDFEVPGLFKDTELDGFIGSVWFRRNFDLSDRLAGKSARLFMGTMVDSDEIYINGVKVGETAYQYPPRKYDVPEGLTREKNNTIAIRLSVENGLGRFTPGKELKIFNENDSKNLEGTWKYRVGAVCERIPATDFVNWKATGLYNAMTAPCVNYPIDGVIWYQGESNAEDDYDYADFTERMVRGYRRLWGDENLPFIAVQLPNFVIDQLPKTDDWGKFRLDQNKILQIPMTGLVVTMGIGEDNDLHPVIKKPIGDRLALWAAHLKYGYRCEYTGPIATAVRAHESTDGKIIIELILTHDQGLHVMDAGKGYALKDFFVVDKKGQYHEASGKVDNGIVEISADVKLSEAAFLRWCCENTYHGGLIVNAAELPMCPFELPIV
ncbi:MAG: hypothetical protein K6B41_04210 [Butyrivibrio sp.]|nr:hypothetical protein [Butyrivibrio sp.]